MRRKWLRRRAAGYDKSSAAERTNFPSEVVEMALAHAVGDKVRPYVVAAIYLRCGAGSEDVRFM
jgi:hypothetical protein